MVTGGAGLLGPEFGTALAEEGAAVALIDVCRETVDASAEMLRGFGGKVLGLCADITDAAAVGTVVAEILSDFGRIDVLVNGAAGRPAGFFAAFEDYTLADWNDVMSVNLSATFLCCQAVGRHMQQRGGGSIINISSVYGVVAPDQRIYENSSINTPAVYSASKAGVIGLTRYLSTYWAKHDIRVNAITPGGISNHQDPAFVAQYEKRTPMGRMGRPDELRGAIVFLASDMASYVTGHNLVVDGGWTVW